MKKSDILEKVQNLVNLLEDNFDYDYMKCTIEVREDCDRTQKFSYELET